MGDYYHRTESKYHKAGTTCSTVSKLRRLRRQDSPPQEGRISLLRCSLIVKDEPDTYLVHRAINKNSGPSWHSAQSRDRNFLSHTSESTTHAEPQTLSRAAFKGRGPPQCSLASHLSVLHRGQPLG